MKKQKSKLKVKKVRGPITLLKALPYRGNMVYLRRIGIDVFEYLVIFEKQLYTNFYNIKPPKGKKDLTKDQVNQAAALAMAGACATVDLQLGGKLDKKTEETVKIFESGRKKVLN